MTLYTSVVLFESEECWLLGFQILRCVVLQYVLWYPFDDADRDAVSRFRMEFD